MEQNRKLRVKQALQTHLADRIAELPAGVSDNTIKELIATTVRSEGLANGNWNEDDIARMSNEMVDEFLGLGPIQPLMADEKISEIMINGGGTDREGNLLPPITWVEKNGVLMRRDDIAWDGEDHVRRVMNRILGRQGRRIDESNPIEDGSLKDGSRFNGTLYPICPDGSTFNIRRFCKDRVSAQQLIEFGTASLDEMTFLTTLTASKGTILISGGTGSGKTTLLNILASYIPHTERIITIEDTCELLVHESHPHVVRLEGRKPNAEGAGEVTLADHLKSALRKRPDRIIVGECRGAEAYTMLEAMNTGHDGSMTTIHANDPMAALRRLVTLVKQGDTTLSEEIIKEKIADSIDCVVQVSRLPSGKRVIMQVEEIGEYIDGTIHHDTLFSYQRDPSAIDGNGTHRSNNTQPRRIKKKIIDAGYEYDPSWFIGGEMS